MRHVGLRSLTTDRTQAFPALGAQSLSHWTTREVPLNVFFKSKTQLPRKERVSLKLKILRNCKPRESIGTTNNKIKSRSNMWICFNRHLLKMERHSLKAKGSFSPHKGLDYDQKSIRIQVVVFWILFFISLPLYGNLPHSFFHANFFASPCLDGKWPFYRIFQTRHAMEND